MEPLQDNGCPALLSICADLLWKFKPDTCLSVAHGAHHVSLLKNVSNQQITSFPSSRERICRLTKPGRLADPRLRGNDDECPCATGICAMVPFDFDPVCLRMRTGLTPPAT